MSGNIPERVWFAGIGVETTQGTEQATRRFVPLTQRPTVDPQASPEINRPIARTDFGADQTINDGDTATCTWAVELANHAAAVGDAADLSYLDEIFRACSMATIVNAGVDVTHSFVTTGQESITAENRHDRNKYLFVGMMASSAVLNFNAGQLPFIDLGLTGKRKSWGNQAVTETMPDWKLPVRVSKENTTLTLGGNTTCISQLSIDLGLAISDRDADTCGDVKITNAAQTGSVTLLDPGFDVQDWLQESIDNTEMAFSLVHGPAGNRIQVEATGVTLGKIDNNAAVNGSAAKSIPLIFNSGLTIKEL